MNRINHHRTDTELVANIAQVREWSEFDVFKAAHIAWFEKHVSDREIERFFVRYLFYQQVPYWVRHYVRNIQLMPAGNAPHRGFDPSVIMACVWAACAGATRRLLGQPKSDALLIA